MSDLAAAAGIPYPIADAGGCRVGRLFLIWKTGRGCDCIPAAAAASGARDIDGYH
jgi:hypothetical protein